MSKFLKLVRGQLDYCPETGVFRWKVGHRRIQSGKIAGRINQQGYGGIKIGGKEYQSHRLAWFYFYGEWPDHIDHINHNRADNRIANLQSVRAKDNNRNRTLQKNNKSGCTGVVWNRGRWQAQIKVNRGNVHLGRFRDWFEAVCVRKSAENKFGFHPNHGQPKPQGAGDDETK